MTQPIDGEVRDLELTLLTSSTRRDAGRLRTLLHEDFVEIGRSGTRWTREAVIAALGGEAAREPVTTDEWVFHRPSDGLVLVTYRIDRPDGVASRHASLWDVASRPFRLRFHQGTPVTG